MTKPLSTSKKSRKQRTPEFRLEALKLAERIGVAAAARKLNLYESQLYDWRSKQKRESELAAENASLKRQMAEWDEDLAIIQKAET